jgi:hypothetical protein
MGLPACGLDQGKHLSSTKKEDHALLSKSRKLIWVISNVIILSLLIGAVDYSTQVNNAFEGLFSKKEKKIKKKRQSTQYKTPRFMMKHVLLYPRMYQNWNMFSPKVITYEKWAIADLTFDNGETLSLFRNSENIENRFKREYFTPYNNQFWRKLFSRLGKTSYQKHIPKFKKWLMETDYFPEYAGRKVTSVKLWQLSEKSPAPETPIDKRPKVIKSELKKKQKGPRKSRKNSDKKSKEKQPYKKHKIM